MVSFAFCHGTQILSSKISQKEEAIINSNIIATVFGVMWINCINDIGA
jgi:hypothetical protein